MVIMVLKEEHMENRATEIRKLTGLSQRRFAEKYGIPRRTIENWEMGVSTAPDYVLNMLERIVREDEKQD